MTKDTGETNQSSTSRDPVLRIANHVKKENRVKVKPTYLLNTDSAKSLYETCRLLPIYDYHCHLSPREIWEDREFTDISELWLGGDHYKWQLMRAAGVPERFITGDSSRREKFRAYAETILQENCLLRGNPFRQFGIHAD